MPMRAVHPIGTYNLSTWAPVKNSVLLRRLYNTPGDPVSVTVRITTVALRETRVGDKVASRHGQKGTVGGILMDQSV